MHHTLLTGYQYVKEGDRKRKEEEKKKVEEERTVWRKGI